MSRRGAAIAAIVVALVVLIAGPTWHRELGGSAAPAATDDSPADGLCVLETDRTRAVTCADPHTAQIIRTWNTGGERFSRILLGDLKRGCWQRGQAVLQPLGLDRLDPYTAPVPPPGWAPPLIVFDTDVITFASETEGGDVTACVISPRSAVSPDINAPLTRAGQFAGTIGDLIPMPSRPINLRVCYALADQLPATVSCRSWHRGEVLAARSAEDGTPTQDDDTTCRSTAADLLGTQDPTHGGQLTIRVDSRPVVGQVALLPQGQENLFLLRCVIETTDDKFLTDSVIGLGDDPLPLN